MLKCFAYCYFVCSVDTERDEGARTEEAPEPVTSAPPDEQPEPMETQEVITPAPSEVEEAMDTGGQSGEAPAGASGEGLEPTVSEVEVTVPEDMDDLGDLFRPDLNIVDASTLRDVIEGLDFGSLNPQSDMAAARKAVESQFTQGLQGPLNLSASRGREPTPPPSPPLEQDETGGQPSGSGDSPRAESVEPEERESEPGLEGGQDPPEAAESIPRHQFRPGKAVGGKVGYSDEMEPTMFRTFEEYSHQVWEGVNVPLNTMLIGEGLQDGEWLNLQDGTGIGRSDLVPLSDIATKPIRTCWGYPHENYLVTPEYPPSEPDSDDEDHEKYGVEGTYRHREGAWVPPNCVTTVRPIDNASHVAGEEITSRSFKTEAHSESGETVLQFLPVLEKNAGLRKNVCNKDRHAIIDEFDMKADLLVELYGLCLRTVQRPGFYLERKDVGAYHDLIKVTHSVICYLMLRNLSSMDYWLREEMPFDYARSKRVQEWRWKWSARGSNMKQFIGNITNVRRKHFRAWIEYAEIDGPRAGIVRVKFRARIDTQEGWTSDNVVLEEYDKEAADIFARDPYVKVKGQPLFQVPRTKSGLKPGKKPSRGRGGSRPPGRGRSATPSPVPEPTGGPQPQRPPLLTPKPRKPRKTKPVKKDVGPLKKLVFPTAR